MDVVGSVVVEPKRGKKVFLPHNITHFFFVFLLDQVLKHRVEVSLHGAWTESKCAGKIRKEIVLLLSKHGKPCEFVS